jgi:acyl-CoA synthetase (AMP-forming)/AMP-acid ligase II
MAIPTPYAKLLLSSPAETELGLRLCISGSAALTNVIHSEWKDKGVYTVIGSESPDIINSGGYRIGAKEIEQAVLDFDWCTECVVLGVPDEVIHPLSNNVGIWRTRCNRDSIASDGSIIRVSKELAIIYVIGTQDPVAVQASRFLA